ncbi:MAG: porin [Granulosicoccus sp.]|nr:porin [Granulosicoccus sp.]
MQRKQLVVAAAACCLMSGFAYAQEQITSELDASLRLGLGLNTEPDAELTFENYASRIRWSGSADAGKGLKAISYLEFGFDQDAGVSNTRHAWLGVEGDFGTLKGGKQYSAFYDAVTSAVDIAYWGSCYHELSCSRSSSVIKFTGPEDADIQYMASTILVPNDTDNDFIDGIDIGARTTSGDLSIGAGATLLIGNSIGGMDLGTGVGLGLSVSKPVDEATVSLSLQFANEDYIGGDDSGFVIAGTYSKDQYYGIVSLADSDNTPFYITLGYEKPVINDRAFTYFELSAVEPDIDGQDIDLQARAVMVFNMDLLSMGR